MFGAKMTETKGNKLFLSRDSEAAFGTQSANFFFSRDSEAAFRAQSATMGGSFWMFGAKMTETNGNKLFFSRDSEAAFGTQSATMGGWFWTRIRLGKAVAGPGVRGQDDRDK